MATSAAAARSSESWKPPTRRRRRGWPVADQQPGGRGAQGGAVPAAAAPKYAWPAKPVLLGTAVKRLDGPDKVTGRARYSYDITRPGMIYGRIVRSPYPHARIVSVDLAAAEKAPGVKAVLAWKEPGAQVMYQGDPVAGVAADTEERANDAARLIRVQYEPLPHLNSVDQALDPGAPPVFPGGNTRQGAQEETGDLAAGFAR